MINEEGQNFSELMMGLAEVYECEISDIKIRIYWEALKEFDLKEIKDSVNHIVKTRVYAGFPKPAEFIEYLRPAEKLEEQTMIAVDAVMDKMEWEGSWNTVKFEDKVIHLVIERMGGWIRICEEIRRINQGYNPDKERTIWEAKFRKRYMSMCSHQVEESTPILLGRLDQKEIEEGRKERITGIESIIPKFLPEDKKN